MMSQRVASASFTATLILTTTACPTPTGTEPLPRGPVESSVCLSPNVMEVEAAAEQCNVPVYGTLTVHRDRECRVTGSAGFGEDRVNRVLAASVEVTWTPSNRSVDTSKPVVFIVRADTLADDVPNGPIEGFFVLDPFDLNNAGDPGSAAALAADPMHMSCPTSSLGVLGGKQESDEWVETDAGYDTHHGVLTEEELLRAGELCGAEVNPQHSLDEAKGFLDEIPVPSEGPPDGSCPKGGFLHFIF
jgi:hypothetical protein